MDLDLTWQRLAIYPFVSGITLSGGEPFLQPHPAAWITRKFHAIGKTVSIYTGFRLEDILMKDDPDRMELLIASDVLVDGPFIEAGQRLDLLFRGSANQRLIDVQKSMSTGNISLWHDELNR